MKDLPKVTPVKIDKELENFQTRFYSDIAPFPIKKTGNVINKVKDIFTSNNHVYKSKVRIYTKDDILEKLIVGKTNTHLLTLNGEKIKIVDIIDIERV